MHGHYGAVSIIEAPDDTSATALSMKRRQARLHPHPDFARLLGGGNSEGPGEGRIESARIRAACLGSPANGYRARDDAEAKGQGARLDAFRITLLALLAAGWRVHQAPRWQR